MQLLKEGAVGVERVTRTHYDAFHDIDAGFVYSAKDCIGVITRQRF